MAIDRRKLDSFFQSLEKEYGKGSVYSIDTDEANLKIERWSTGIEDLDDILGGGMPFGRIVELFGAESAGKCLTEDTYILTAYGYKTIKEIFNEVGEETFCVNKDKKISYPLINKNGDIEETSHFTWNGKRKLIKITFKNGITQKVTYKHPILVLDEFGNHIWKYADALVVGDVAVGRVGDKIDNGNYPITRTEAYLIGLLVADGTLLDRRIFFTNDDEDIKTIFIKNINKIIEFKDLEINKYDNNGKGSISYHINSKEKVSQFYQRTGLTSVASKNKYVPKIINESSLEIQKHFLRGYIDCECHVDGTNLEIKSASYELLHTVQLMLNNFGILSTLNEKNVKQYEKNEYFRLILDAESTQIYFDTIGTESNLRIEQFDGGSTCSMRHIPNINELCYSYYMTIEPHQRDRQTAKIISDIRNNKCDVTYRRMEKLLQLDGDLLLKHKLQYITNKNFYYTEVLDIEQIEPEKTFDVCMPITHSFIAETIINHNTSLAYHLMARHEVAIDLPIEGTFSVERAKVFGNKKGQLYVRRAETGEQCFEFIDNACQCKVPIIVIDSVPHMITEKEFEEDDYTKEPKPGRIAALMSRRLPKTVHLCEASKTTIIFINQLRDEMNSMMFAPQDHTPGGRALKHNCSIRLKVARKEWIKIPNKNPKNTAKDVNVGLVMKVKVIKSKVCNPHGECEIPLFFDRGFVSHADIESIRKELMETQRKKYKAGKGEE